MLEIDSRSTAKQPDGTLVNVSAVTETSRKAQAVFADAVKTIQISAGVLLNELKTIGPDEICLEFGIKFNAELNAYVSKTSGEANFVAKLTWKKA